MNERFTIQAKAVRKIVNAAAGKGVAERRLLAASGLNSNLLSDPDCRIPFAQIVSLYETGAQLTGDSFFGLHVGETVNPSAFDVVGFSALNSATLGEAFDRVQRYHSIWTDGADFTIHATQPVSSIVYTYCDASITEHRQDSEMTLATVVSLCRRVAVPDWTPLAVEFQHQAPTDSSELLRVFRCEIRFSQPANRLLFDSTTLALPIDKADPALIAVLDRHAHELLSRFPPHHSLLDQVRSIIARELNGGDASLERIAQQLGLSPRTLQRKLQELDTTHNELLDQARHELAVTYLREQEMAICEVAYLLGFSEPSSFHRAFKRWTGKTPKEFRSSVNQE
jgi:AraC-like DNA-binding protein